MLVTAYGSLHIREIVTYFCNNSEIIVGRFCRFFENRWSSLYNCIVACCAFAKLKIHSSGTRSSCIPRRIVIGAGIFCSNSRESFISSRILNGIPSMVWRSISGGIIAGLRRMSCLTVGWVKAVDAASNPPREEPIRTTS
jgi:hypothetical protein